MPQATMINPDIPYDPNDPESQRRVEVEAGGDAAQGYFGSGYFLETSFDENTGESTWDAGDQNTETPLDIATEDDAQGSSQGSNGGRFDHISDPNRKAYMEQQYADAGSPEGGWNADMSDFDPNTDYTGIDIDDDSSEDDGELSDDQQALQDAYDEGELAADEYTSKMAELTATMEENNASYIEEIKRSFEIRKRQMAQLNKMSLAGITKSGIRSGRQRYASEINTGIVTAEESAGIARLTELDSQEKMLILQAKNAMTEKSMDMLNKSYALIKERQAEKEALILNLRQLSIQEEERNRAKMTFARQKEEWATQDANVRLESLMSSGVGLDNLNADEISSLENDLGMESGTLQGFYEGLQAAQQAEAVGDAIELQKSIINMLKDIPEGMEITIGDSTYMGMKDTVNEYTYTEIIGNQKYQVAVDKETGEEIWRKSAGQAYKPATPKTPKVVDPNELTDEEETFQDDLKEQRTKLANGTTTWANAWNIIKGNYPDIDNATLDELLNKNKYYEQDTTE